MRGGGGAHDEVVGACHGADAGEAPDEGLDIHLVGGEEPFFVNLIESFHMGASVHGAVLVDGVRS